MTEPRFVACACTDCPRIEKGAVLTVCAACGGVRPATIRPPRICRWCRADLDATEHVSREEVHNGAMHVSCTVTTRTWTPMRGGR